MAEAPARNRALLTEPELRARLDELYRAIDEFNHGWWFESHETLEDLWMVTPLPDRTFFQGIIQLAAALVHFARREYPGIIKLLDLALEKLREFAPEHRGVDVARLVNDAERVRAEFVALGPERFLEWDEERAPRIGCTPAT
jgi:predicted metal-dependent hydrolase